MRHRGTGFGLTTVDGRRPRVAIVDGNPTSAIVTTTLVEQFGCAPETASTSEALLHLLEQGRPVDVVLMDLSFADKDGVPATQLARTIGEQGPMPIVVLAGKAEAAAPSGDSQADFTGAVVKPYSPRDLHAALQSALSGAPPTAADHR